MTEPEIEEMKKELILLRMHKKRLESDLQKMQAVIHHLMLDGISEEESNKDERVELISDNTANNP